METTFNDKNFNFLEVVELISDPNILNNYRKVLYDTFNEGINVIKNGLNETELSIEELKIRCILYFNLDSSEIFSGSTKLISDIKQQLKELNNILESIETVDSRELQNNSYRFIFIQQKILGTLQELTEETRCEINEIKKSVGMV